MEFRVHVGTLGRSVVCSFTKCAPYANCQEVEAQYYFVNRYHCTCTAVLTQTFLNACNLTISNRKSGVYCMARFCSTSQGLSHLPFAPLAPGGGKMRETQGTRFATGSVTKKRKAHILTSVARRNEDRKHKEGNPGTRGGTPI